jgi:hypothetical protein
MARHLSDQTNGGFADLSDSTPLLLPTCTRLGGAPPHVVKSGPWFRITQCSKMKTHTVIEPHQIKRFSSHARDTVTMLDGNRLAHGSQIWGPVTPQWLGPCTALYPPKFLY